MVRDVGSGAVRVVGDQAQCLEEKPANQRFAEWRSDVEGRRGGSASDAVEEEKVSSPGGVASRNTEHDTS